MSVPLAEIEKNNKNKDTLLQGLRQERWLKTLILFSREDDNTSITRQCRPHFSPNPFCPLLWTKHIAFLMPGRLCSRWYRNPSYSIMLCKQTDLSCWCSCLLVLEYSEICKWLWCLPDSLGICEVQRNKIQSTKIKKKKKEKKWNQRYWLVSSTTPKAVISTCFWMYGFPEHPYESTSKGNLRASHVNEPEWFWIRASSKTELDTPCSHMLQADQLSMTFQSLQVTQIKEFPTISQCPLKYSVIII